VKCARCSRPLKNPSTTGMGPVCARAVLGAKPRREKREERKSADARQIALDLGAQP
jgi:hypothetical protein